MSIKTELLEKIEQREAVISVIGLGYVGLPLVVEFAKEGYRIIGVDVDEEKVRLLNEGVSYIPDVPTEKIAELVGKGLIEATTDYSVLTDVDVISICVPTPLRKTKDPDMSYIISAADENQLSQEDTKWGGGHGVFTWYLLEGLKGEADFDKNNQVNIG